MHTAPTTRYTTSPPRPGVGGGAANRCERECPGQPCHAPLAQPPHHQGHLVSAPGRCVQGPAQKRGPLKWGRSCTGAELVGAELRCGCRVAQLLHSCIVAHLHSCTPAVLVQFWYSRRCNGRAIRYCPPHVAAPAAQKRGLCACPAGAPGSSCKALTRTQSPALPAALDR